MLINEILFPSQLKNFDFSSISDLISDALCDSLKKDPINTLHNVEPDVRIIIIRKVRNHVA